MVDVSAKALTRRKATVRGTVRLSPAAFTAIQQQQLIKGDALTVAHLAGLQAAKRTHELIPLCHPLQLEHVTLAFQLDEADSAVHITCETTITAKTGVEMEAFVGASIAAVALYDMVKAVDPLATIAEIKLIKKSRGKTSVTCAQPW